MFIPSGQDCAASMVAWDECIGMLDKGIGSGSERFDAMWCDSALAQHEDAHVLLGLPVMPELGNKEDTLNTILSYSETDLIPVSVKSAVAEKGVEVVVTDGVAQKFGGFGVVDLRLRNLSLLAKWAWRFAMEPSSLWRAVLVAKYGAATPGWRMNVFGLRLMSLVWREIVSLIASPELSPFLDVANYCWKVRSGTTVLFWLDPWCIEVPLKEVFPHLFSLVHNKFARVLDYAQAGTFAHATWESFFRRQLRSFELKGLDELRALVLPFHLRESVQTTSFGKLQCWVSF
ncbi:hypothetical protein V6N12_050579 [Hibiscus sabdariffa]|uniref:Reverse transcriptase zinc-binding domain-containing protein n=1 Tax=Hibiscus sabdariffa TaxID=183260 RepID=A0ABR2GCT3_9ROSI